MTTNGVARPATAGSTEPLCGFASRGQNGVFLVDGPFPAPIPDESRFQTSSVFPGHKAPNCRIFAFSPDGLFFAFHSGDKVQVVNTQNGQLLLSLDMPRTQFICFSSKGTILCLWEQFTCSAKDPKGDPNLTMWNVATGNLEASHVMKKHHNWEPVWTDNEDVCCRSTSSFELNFFENNDFSKTSAKLHIQKTVDFAITPHVHPPNIASYVPGTKGSPSFVRLYKYPNLSGHSAAIAQKSFFRADSVEMKWNRRGTALLILTTVEVSESSYMGEQGLHYIATNGEGCNVELDKKGPIYSVAWSPNSAEFCVVYGLMPAKAKLFNHKAEPLYDMGAGPRNSCAFNLHGNILVLTGFGNLRGNMEFWDVKKKQMISNPRAPDSTVYAWAPDGVHVMTATTAPRLRVGNGYKVWHYDGTCIYQETLTDIELWDVQWKPAKIGVYKEKSIRYPSGGTKAAAAAAQPAVQAYRPPMAQGRACAFKLHDDEDLAPAGGAKSADSKQSKNAKKREAKKARQAAEAADTAPPGAAPAATSNAQSRPQTATTTSTPGSAQPPQQQKEHSPLMGPGVLTGDPETDKRIKNLQKKLREINGLKKAQESGKKLELNQLSKLEKEDELATELKSLCIKE